MSLVIFAWHGGLQGLGEGDSDSGLLGAGGREEGLVWAGQDTRQPSNGVGLEPVADEGPRGEVGHLPPQVRKPTTLKR